MSFKKIDNLEDIKVGNFVEVTSLDKNKSNVSPFKGYCIALKKFQNGFSSIKIHSRDWGITKNFPLHGNFSFSLIKNGRTRQSRAYFLTNCSLSKLKNKTKY